MSGKFGNAPKVLLKANLNPQNIAKMASSMPNSGFRCTMAYPTTPRAYWKVGRMICDQSHKVVELLCAAFDVLNDFGDAGLGVLRVTRLGVIRLPPRGLAFLARMLFDSGVALGDDAFSEPEANIEGMISSGSTEFCRDSSRADLRCPDADGVRGETCCGCGDNAVTPLLDRRLDPRATPVSVLGVSSCLTTSMDRADGWGSSSLS